MTADRRQHKLNGQQRAPAPQPFALVSLHTTAGLLQPRLTIGPVDDPYEREAEHVADQVLRMPAPSIQRAPAQIQRAANGAAPEVTPAIEGQIQALRGGGQPLKGAVRRFMEPRFGYDFESVRVHTGPQAARAASGVNALAFTLGNDVVFGTGQYQPSSAAGQRLIAHELTHVVQQQGNQASTMIAAYQAHRTNDIYRKSSSKHHNHKHQIRLVFVPDEKYENSWDPAGKSEADNAIHLMGVLHILEDQNEIAAYDARGGPKDRGADQSNPGHTFGPTPTGKYSLSSGKSHKSGSWLLSQIPWGAQIRDIRQGKHPRVEFSTDGKHWHLPKKPISREEIGREEVILGVKLAIGQRKITSRNQLDLDSDGNIVVIQSGDKFMTKINGGSDIYASIPDKWNLNDFGEVAFHVTGTQSFIHTTPDNEMQRLAGIPEKLDFSHGCIHIKPSDRDEMISKGYLKGGVTLIVKGYRKSNQWGKPR